MAQCIRIGQACPASWDDMSPAGDGRFCSHCSKVVVDLTQCTEAEARARVAGGGHCIRLRIDVAGRAVFAGTALAGAMALAACDGGNNGASAGANTSGASPTQTIAAASGTATGAAPGAAPVSGFGTTPTAVVPANMVVLGKMAPMFDPERAVAVALDAVAKLEKWTQLSGELIPMPSGQDPFDMAAPRFVRVRRVLEYRSDGTPVLANEPAYRVELRYGERVTSCQRES